jgi:hypothetical protein
MPPLVQQAPVQPEFSSQSQDIVTTFHPLHSSDTEFLGISLMPFSFHCAAPLLRQQVVRPHYSYHALVIHHHSASAQFAHLPDIHHGSVLEGIIAIQHTDKPGTRITAGLLLANVYRNSYGSYLGGFACEYAGNGSVEEAEANLREAMQQLFARRYKTKFYKLEFGKLLVRTYTPEKSSGTILVGIGFASYVVPCLD